MVIHLTDCRLGGKTHFTVPRVRNRFKNSFHSIFRDSCIIKKSFFISPNHCLCFNFNSISWTFAIHKAKDSAEKPTKRWKTDQQNGNNILIHFVITEISFMLSVAHLLKIHPEKSGDPVYFDESVSATLKCQPYHWMVIFGQVLVLECRGMQHS